MDVVNVSWLCSDCASVDFFTHLIKLDSTLLCSGIALITVTRVTQTSDLWDLIIV